MKLISMEPFPLRLRVTIAKYGVRNTDLAKALGVTRQMITYYCNGRNEPSLEKIVKIADYLGVSVDYLLGKSDEE